MKTVKELAEEASISFKGWALLHAECTMGELERFAALVRAQALEEAAKLCEGNHILSGGNGPNFNRGWDIALRSCAKAIRARSIASPQRDCVCSKSASGPCSECAAAIQALKGDGSKPDQEMTGGQT